MADQNRPPELKTGLSEESKGAAAGLLGGLGCASVGLAPITFVIVAVVAVGVFGAIRGCS